MSEHDPLCEKAWGYPGFLVSRGIEREDCWMCELFAAARAEWEAEGPWFKSVVHQCCEDKQTAFADGIKAARKAVEAIPAPYRVKGQYETYGPHHEGKSDMKDLCISAIDALREKQ